MISPTSRQNAILVILSEQKSSSSDVFSKLQSTVHASALVTIKRDLDELLEAHLCTREGAGRSTLYCITALGLLLTAYDLNSYLGMPPDTRGGSKVFNFELFSNWPTQLLSNSRSVVLQAATTKYIEISRELSSVVQAKELERFIVELAWKSSAIEGNTYTLRDTERLLSLGMTTPGYAQAETQMIINHKTALQFVLNEAQKNPGQVFVEEVHALLTFDLGVVRGVRKTLVGITGTSYRPLDNQYQINEALAALYTTIARLENPIEKAFLALVGISYIQPFEDGNKRTARLVANGILLAHNCAPLSYRSVEVEQYRSAMVLFYERNSAAAVLDIFFEQYLFATDNYRVLSGVKN